MANDPNWNSVVLAMHMDDVVLADMKGHAVTLNGNISRSAAQAKFGGYSAYCDGNNDYITLASSSDWAFGKDDLTIEFFLYRAGDTTTGTANSAILLDLRIAEPSAQIELHLTGSAHASPQRVVLYVNGSDRLVSASQVTAGFTHVALVRSSGSTKLYLNGTAEGGTYTDANDYASAAMTICGRFAALSADYRSLNGYIDDLRITKGIARYSANFSVPTAAFPNTPPQLSGTVKDSSGSFASRPVIAIPRNRASIAYATISDSISGAFTLPAYDASSHTVIALPIEGDPHWGCTVFSMHMDGANGSTTFTDEKGHSVTPTASTLTTATQKFGTASLSYDGVSAGNLVASSSADFALSGDFTIEGWFKPAADCPTCYALSSNTSFAANAWILEPTHGTNPGKWCFFMHGIAETGRPLVSTSNSLTDAWTHVAITKSGAIYRMFINGICEAMYINAAAMSANSTDAIYVNGGAGRYKGYIDDLRITKGVARYLHDFTPPSSAFPHGVIGGIENALILDNITPV